MNDNPNPPRNVINDAAKPSKRFSLIELLVILAIIMVLAALMLPAVRFSGPAARRAQCVNNLHNIALALHNYAASYGTLPPAYTVDAGGNPLHSWRTLILPYLDESRLYQLIDLSKAWNDPANLEAYATGLPVYRCPSGDFPETHTTYLAVVVPGGCFRPTQPIELRQVTDEPGETMMVIEVDGKHAVHWMSPQDADETLVLGFGPNNGLSHSGGLHAVCADGTVNVLAADMPAAERRAWMTIAGND